MSIRVHQLAKELNLSSRELIAKLHQLKVEVKGHMSNLDTETAEIVREEIGAPERPKLQLKIPLTVKELSVKLGIKPSELIKKMLKLNIFATINQSLNEEEVQKLATEFGYQVERLPSVEEAVIQAHIQEDVSRLVPRAPVITLMGHVDHGKTSLLDMIRKTKITEKEAGGITQHIGAYEVILDKLSGERKGKVTFLDTPGHEAFTAMRARGANATDIVVLVIAADDGVKPQTIEAIDHAKAAGAPIVVAINKCDLPNINIDKVKKQLAELDLTPEDWGGKTITVNVSAKTGEGIDELLDMLLLEAEMLELKANPDRTARGIVIEGRLSKGKGSTATVLVQNGTLKIGDVLIASLHYGKIRMMINDRGHPVGEAKPSDPVEISGLSGVPQAGDLFYVVEDEKEAKEVSLARQNEIREHGIKPVRRVTLEDVYQQIKEGKLKELKIIVKADVQGSVEVLIHSLENLSTKDVTLRIIHSGVSNVNESDIMLAAASQAIVIGFHVDIESRAQAAAERENINVQLYQVIYEVTADVRAAMEGLLEPHIKEIYLGKAEVRQVFKVSKVGTIAGCQVIEGKVLNTASARLIRGEEVKFLGKLSSLKRFKEDVKEVAKGFECGIGLSGFSEIEVGDIIEVFQTEKVARKLGE